MFGKHYVLHDFFYSYSRGNICISKSCRSNDLIEINIDTINLEGSINLIGEDGQNKGVNWGNNELEQRKLRSDLKPQDGLPEDTILWAHLQSLSGGAWNGCVYDFELISKNTL